VLGAGRRRVSRRVPKHPYFGPIFRIHLGNPLGSSPSAGTGGHRRLERAFLRCNAALTLSGLQLNPITVQSAGVNELTQNVCKPGEPQPWKKIITSS
jgi:hypothetical protein